MRTIFFIIPALACVLSGNSFQKRIFLNIQLWYFLISRKFFKFSCDFEIVCIFNGIQLPLFLRYPMDIAVLREVFVDKEYAWFPIDNPKVIIDLGAHFGDTAIYYHALYPDATIIAVEPSPESFERLKKNITGVPQIIPVQAAIGSTDGKIVLNLVESSLGNSVVYRKDITSSISVPQITLDTLYARVDIKKADIIKFDIEGGEEALFTTQNPEDFADAYIGEVHRDLISINADDFVSKFINFDIQQEQLTNQNRFILKAIKKNENV